MIRKIIAGFLIFATSVLFGMSLDELNKASKEELMEVKGVGAKKAEAIIKERKKGDFTSFDDFQRVKGIGEKAALNVKNHVVASSDMKKSDSSKT
ncbi:helix-hairpin-helix domain-containing protein [Sulfurovum sp. XGS-02]|uniref:ComEA family DNA-binding protein n=1 Tax=Sulfurovum sp. XGS-02 TaxID=2925411 RepID=UPI002066CF82|nr:helix-hairpin-helix domain-containing protein [Sulfurovum sp. XGS-02]UPT77649.1 helix-hairpin-helix domain-containing protein [Sulfurovum sp. XGS-02]